MFGNFDFDDIDRDKLKRYILISIIIFFSIIGILIIFPFIFYIIVVLGISIPSYILYKNYKNNQKVIVLAKKVEGYSNKFKKQLNKCSKSLTTRKYIIF